VDKKRSFIAMKALNIKPITKSIPVKGENPFYDISVEEKDFLHISADDEFFLTGQREFLKIHIDENVHAKILFLNTKINFLECQISHNGSLDLDFISLDEKKSNITFNLKEYAKLNLKTISTHKIEEETAINLNAEGADFHGEYFVFAKDYNNFIKTKIVHNAQKTSSDITNFGVALQGGNINFETVGKIEKGKSKSICNQLSRGLILNEKAEITTQPILLIDEYDVQAHHGVTIGKLSDDELFYLMSRGLTKKQSEYLIVSSIVKPFLETLLDEDLRGEVETAISSMLN
jgi:hypothetical protein